MRLLHEPLAEAAQLECASAPAFFDKVFGACLQQAELVGFLIHGGSTLSTGVDWGSVVKTGNVGWQVRCWPRGRLGKRIGHDEVRKVTIRVTQGGTSQIVFCKLWLAEPVEVAKIGNQRSVATYAAHGVTQLATHLFEHHGSDVLELNNFHCGKRGFHAVLGGYVSTVDSVVRGIPMVTSVQACPLGPLVLAASLAGLSFSDGPTQRQETRDVTAKALKATRIAAVTNITEQMQRCGAVSADPDAAATSATSLLAAAECISENLSFAGMLDVLADEFFADALPDALHAPNALQLLMAIAVRVASRPEGAGIANCGTPDDREAAKAASALFESAQAPIIPDAEGTPRFAIDLVIQHSLSRLLTELDSMKRQNMTNMGLSTSEEILCTVNSTLASLYRAGMNLCVDSVGTVPRAESQNAYGMPESTRDPVESALCAAVYAIGLGNLAPRVDPQRCATRAEHQVALARMMASVETWLRSGTFRGHRLQTLCTSEHVDRVTVTPSTDPPTIKKKKPKKRGVDEAARARGKARSDNDSVLAEHALKSVKSDIKTQAELKSVLKLLEKGGGRSIDDAHALLGDFLQCGIGHGATKMMDLQAFLVGTQSWNTCGLCRSPTHVLQSRISGTFAECSNCNHPICLSCFDNLAHARCESPIECLFCESR